MCAESYGFSILYLEAGGAHTPVHPDLIRAAAAASDKLVLLVGGGIRDGATAKIAIEAVQIGSSLEIYAKSLQMHMNYKPPLPLSFRI